MLKRLLYRGPSMEVLHEEYAKKGRLDERAPLSGAYEIRIEAPLERVWTLLSEPANWPSIDPAIHGVTVESSSGGAEVDARFTWVNGRNRIRSRFAVIDPGKELVWTGLAAGAKAVHRHVLEATDDGATLVRTEESMGGPLLVLFFSDAKLHRVLEKWLKGLKKAAEV
ncbi:SRPBCC family protein [Streptomyces sp. NBC_00237]|uniref:SRPBCC family protein n=1 Tax=Streptomyces sp. NBC_00237 TaxID=2975687 RepID=UPI0022548B23|nr:SRPBCC family protein [Streptomyces sp. NBC_00237]MCX5206179.1 SRPBCC family protein [Streptomyces sp. NBC_00237]